MTISSFDARVVRLKPLRSPPSGIQSGQTAINFKYLRELSCYLRISQTILENYLRQLSQTVKDSYLRPSSTTLFLSVIVVLGMGTRLKVGQVGLLIEILSHTNCYLFLSPGRTSMFDAGHGGMEAWRYGGNQATLYQVVLCHMIQID